MVSRFLLSNDDGIHAPGLLALAEVLLEFGSVAIVAPDRERSASSHALTIGTPLRVNEVEFPLAVELAMSVNGTPADCVKLALEQLLPVPPVMVLSGINRGANLGVDVYYSGTVAAAMEGTFSGLPAVSFSLATHRSDADYAAGQPWIRRVLAALLQWPPLDRTLVNVNLPDLPAATIKGVRPTRLGYGRYREGFERRTDPRGRPYYWMKGELEILDRSPDTDLMAVEAGWISVTPIGLDRTDRATLAEFSRQLHIALPDERGETP